MSSLYHLLCYYYSLLSLSLSRVYTPSCNATIYFITIILHKSTQKKNCTMVSRSPKTYEMRNRRGYCAQYADGGRKTRLGSRTWRLGSAFLPSSSSTECPCRCAAVSACLPRSRTKIYAKSRSFAFYEHFGHDVSSSRWLRNRIQG